MLHIRPLTFSLIVSHCLLLFWWHRNWELLIDALIKTHINIMIHGHKHWFSFILYMESPSKLNQTRKKQTIFGSALSFLYFHFFYLGAKPYKYILYFQPQMPPTLNSWLKEWTEELNRFSTLPRSLHKEGSSFLEGCAWPCSLSVLYASHHLYSMFPKGTTYNIPCNFVK